MKFEIKLPKLGFQIRGRVSQAILVFAFNDM